MLPGLGFEDCATRVTYVKDAQLAGQAFSEPARPFAQGAWQFYAFNVSRDQYQVVVNVDADPGSNCAPPLLLLRSALSTLPARYPGPQSSTWWSSTWTAALA